MSQSADPTGAWWVYRLAWQKHTILDQPMLGISGDKVVVSWNDYQPQPSVPDELATFLGEETLVIAKAPLLSGSLRAVRFGLDFERFRLVPARGLGPGNTAYLVYRAGTTFNDEMTNIGLVAIDGVPGESPVRWTEGDPILVGLIAPSPNAPQPNGPHIFDADNRIRSAVWQNGFLWLAADGACHPAGDTGTRGCLRLVKIATGSTPSVVQDLTVGAAGTYLMYPALAFDKSGDMISVFTEVSKHMYAAEAVTGQQASAPPGLVTEPVVIAPGVGPFDDCACSPKKGATRWGDYAGATADPEEPSTVWVTAEYATSTSKADFMAWGTEIAPISFTAPFSATVTVVPSPTPTETSPSLGTFATPQLPHRAAATPAVPLPTVVPRPIAIDSTQIVVQTFTGKGSGCKERDYRLGDILCATVHAHYPGVARPSRAMLRQTIGTVTFRHDGRPLGWYPLNDLKLTTRGVTLKGDAFILGDWPAGQYAAEVALWTPSDSATASLTLSVRP